ncbi:transposase [Oceanobacillus oncorhynchi]|uniref:transposase n=1 Tax=Oceanobacillus oncorhynchi TaxID=545501 RepID=UPI001868D046|nr:transposase [Oceanobacillus oncorhynchi]
MQSMSASQCVPYSTAERYFKKGLQAERMHTQTTCIQDAIQREQLVLRIDDFAVRKGLTYNTGMHDLKGGNMLDIISGRKQEDLQTFQKNIFLYASVAVMMDLSYTYHKLVKKTFPQAISCQPLCNCCDACRPKRGTMIAN